MSPTSGEGLKDNFTITCTDWVDEDSEGPLLYKLEVSYLPHFLLPFTLNSNADVKDASGEGKQECCFGGGCLESSEMESGSLRVCC